LGGGGERANSLAFEQLRSWSKQLGEVGSRISWGKLRPVLVKTQGL